MSTQWVSGLSFRPVCPQRSGCAPDRARRRRGMSIIYVGLILLAAFGLVSLAVDLGRVRVGRLQLSTAADAAAIAGVQKLPVPNQPGAVTDAIAVARQNDAVEGTGGGTPVDVLPADVIHGLYRMNGGTFTPLGSNEGNGNTVDSNECNACKVIARRDGSRKVGLFFARALGLNEVDVLARATAWIRGGTGSGLGLVGLDWVRFNGTTQTDSYDYTQGGYGGQNVHNGGGVGSNGTITLVGTVDIKGDARPGTNFFVDATNNTNVTGWTAPLDYTLVFPVDNPPGGYSPGSYDNSSISQWITGAQKYPKKNDDKATFTNGRYYLSDWNTGNKNNTTINATAGGINSGMVEIYINGSLDMNGTILTINTQAGSKVIFYITGDVGMNGGAEIRINGPDEMHKVSFFVDGNWSTNGGDITNNGAAHNLYISMTGASSTMDISTATSAHIMAPLTEITFHGNANNPPADFWGYVIGQTLDVKGNSKLHYDESLPNQAGLRRASLIR